MMFGFPTKKKTGVVFLFQTTPKNLLSQKGKRKNNGFHKGGSQKKFPSTPGDINRLGETHTFFLKNHKHPEPQKGKKSKSNKGKTI